MFAREKLPTTVVGMCGLSCRRADDMAMTQTVQSNPQQDSRDYREAVNLLATGQIQAGVHLLGEIVRRTPDDLLRSNCVYNLGEVLDKLGQTDEAYRTYYPLAHKPPAQRNEFDLHARCRVMETFVARALRVPPPDFPPKVQVEITNRCNLRCVMCPRNKMRRKLGDIAFETFQRIADECGTEAGCVLSLFFLGESLLHPDLERMIRYLESVKHRSPVPPTYGIQTNGTLLTRELSRSLLSAGLREICISLDALDGDLERVRRGASYAVIEKNIHDLLEVAREMGIDDLDLAISKLCDDPDSAEAKHFLQRWEGKVSQVHLMHINKIEGLAYLASDGSIHEVGLKQHAPPRAYCGEGSRLLIHWNGDFAFCCSDIDGDLKLGNIRDRTIRQAWNSPEIQQVRRKILTADYEGLDACLKCPHSYK